MYLGNPTFVSISWMSKKQSSVSHSSTESEIISWDAGLRMDGLLAIDLWDTVIKVLRSTSNTVQPNHTSIQETGATLDSKTKAQKVVEYVPTDTHSSKGESQLYVFEDTEAVIKIVIKGRSPTMRHVSRTHRVALDWLFDRIGRFSRIESLSSFVQHYEFLDVIYEPFQ